MIKFICVFALLAVSCLALPVEDLTSKLPRPSPINPEVTSDPKPTDGKEVSPIATTATSTESHIQKVPASGVKLSVEVAKNEEALAASSTTPEPAKDHPKRSVESDSEASSTKAKPPAFRRNQPSTTTEQPSSTTASSTTSSPVSVKTPIGTTRSKREVDITAATASSAATVATKRTTTAAPATGSDDKDGPHFVRPVPVDQILKNLNQPDSYHKTETSKQAKESKEQVEDAEGKEEESPKKEQPEQKVHQQTHPVIRQQGA
uniref:Uncharacterized protein n=1 Tax=Anopheles farauti TaxID=69004 RepID=A0A182QAZ6_9DIPT